MEKRDKGTEMDMECELLSHKGDQILAGLTT